MKSSNRWVILIVSFIANIIIGSAYAWSVFAAALQAAYTWTPAQTSLAFTLSLGLVPVAMIIAGKVQAKLGVKLTILIGGLIFGAGFALASFASNNLTVLYLTYGTMGGIGIGFVYGSTIPNSVKWFPDKRGLAGGIIAGGFGGGAVLFAPLFGALIGNIGPLSTFMWSGIIFGVVVVIASLFISAPAADYKPKGWEPPVAAGAPGGAIVNLSVGQMLKTGKFWILFIMYTLACVTGLMIISNAANVYLARIEEFNLLQLSLIPDEVLTPARAVGATAVVFLGIANTLGRLFWGAVSDKIGRYPTLLLMYAMTAGMLIWITFATSFIPFLIALMGIGLCFGGFLGVFPSITAENFGTANLGMNYGVLFLAFGIAAVVGPQMIGLLYGATLSHNMAFIIAMIMSVVALLITLFLTISLKKAAK